MPIKPTPNLKDFIGEWEGKWDGTWKVRLTITPADDEKKVKVVYEWEEKIGQDPLEKMTLMASVKGDVLKIGTLIDMTLSSDDADRGYVKGNFRKPRTSEMTRAKSK